MASTTRHRRRTRADVRAEYSYDVVNGGDYCAGPYLNEDALFDRVLELEQDAARYQHLKAVAPQLIAELEQDAARVAHLKAVNADHEVRAAARTATPEDT